MAERFELGLLVLVLPGLVLSAVVIFLLLVLALGHLSVLIVPKSKHLVLLHSRDLLLLDPLRSVLKLLLGPHLSLSSSLHILIVRLLVELILHVHLSSSESLLLNDLAHWLLAFELIPRV